MLYINSKLGYINVGLIDRLVEGPSVKITIYRPCFRDLHKDSSEGRELSLHLTVFNRDTVGNLLEMLR